MKKKFMAGIIAAIGFTLGFTSCSDDSSAISSGLGMGRISPKVVIDSKIISASIEQASRANEDVAVTVTNLHLKLTSDDGSFSQEWESVNDFDETQDFKVGDYTLEAYYGSDNDAEGYSKPHFHGSQDLTVKYDHTTEVELSAELKNSRVFVRYTDAFKDYMKDYRVQILSPRGKYISMPGDETSPAYVVPGTVNVNLTFTKPNSSSPTSIEAARFEAKPKTEHVVTFDISGGDAGADAVIKVIFDDTVDTEDVIIDLSDELMNAPAPDLTPEGWTSGQNFHLIEYSPAPGQIKANIIAQSKISAVYLNTESTSLTSQGWPATIDLTKANQAEIAILKSLGLNAIGIWKNPDVMGVIDFTDVFTHLGVSLGYEESEHKFSIQVKDRYGKLSEEYVFSVLSGAGHVNILSGVAEVGLKTIIAEIEYNGSCNLSDVTFEMRNLTGTFDKLTLTEVTPVAGQAGTYTVKLTSDKAILSSHTVRATFGSSTSDFDLVVKTPPFVIEASPNDAFAHSATITIDCEEADDAAVAQNLTFTLNGRVWENYTINGADVTFTRLRAGTKYTIEASNNDNSASAEITTETEDHLPGCDHGDTDDHSVGFGTSSWANPTKLGDYQYLWTTSTGWGTMNELTTSTYGSGSGNGFNTGGCSYKATSGTIPANGRSTQSFVNGGRAGTTTHADGHTTGNASLHKDKQNSGTNAALIRTVGWGSGNSAHGDANIFTDAKDNNAFGTCQNMTPGELYLGEYTDGPQYGIPFTSRPSGVSFYYHYDVVTSGNGDYGTAKIEVCDADGVTIAADSIKLEERSTYDKKNPTSIYLDYKKGAKKAARIKIIFRSTDKYLENNPALKEDKRYWNVPGDNNTSGGEYVGSELYIDDISLIY